MKVRICKCKQCKFVKNKSSKRNFKKKIKKLLNHKRRKGDEGKAFTFYYA